MGNFSSFVLDEIISHDEIANEIIAKVHSVSNPERQLNVSIQEYSLSDKKQGSEFGGILVVDYVLGFRECEDASLSYKFQNVVGIKTIVKVIEIVDECTIYAQTAFHDKLVRVEFEKKIYPRINSYIEIEGELHVMEKDNSIIELIRKCYDGNIELYAPITAEIPLIPDELKDILMLSNGVMEIMTNPNTGKKEKIGWIIYQYAELLEQTDFFKDNYDLKGIVFADDGAGNPYYLLDGKVYRYMVIDNESEIVAESLMDFYTR